MRKTRILGPFLGLQTSLDPKLIGNHNSPDLLNVATEDGQIKPRAGYAALSTNLATSIHGFDYLQGYDGSTLVEHFIKFQNIGGAVKPWHIHPSTLAETEITGQGGAPLSLHASDWRSVAWQNYAYCFNPNETNSVKRIELGELDSWLDMLKPQNPTAPLTILKVSEGSPDVWGGYRQINFTGATFAGTGCCTGGAVVSSSTAAINHDNTAPGDASVTITLAAAQDWSHIDGFFLTLWDTWPVSFEPGTFKVSLLNGDATPIELFPSLVMPWGYTETGGSQAMGLIVRFDEKVRADYDNIRKLKFEYYINSVDGGTWNLSGLKLLVDVRPTDTKSLEFGYSYYNSTTGFESGISGTAHIENDSLNPGVWGGLPPIYATGVYLKLTATAPPVDAVCDPDKWRLYVKAFADWHLVAEQNARGATDFTYEYKLTYKEASELAEADLGEFDAANVCCACTFKGWMVWGYDRGYQNIKHSRIGEPEKQASDLDGEDDLARGATFSLADNFSDAPLAMFECGDVLLLLGSQGVYAQTGNAPFAMTPPIRLSGAQGVAGKFACCRWHDPSGAPGVAFVSKHGDGVYFASAPGALSGNEASQVVELSVGIRGYLREFFLDSPFEDFSQLKMGVDEARNALWICLGKKALVLRRTSLVDGQRQWEPYEFEFDGDAYIAYLCFTTKYGMRWVLTTGQVDQVERDPATGESFASDGGNPIPAPYYCTNVFGGESRRVDLVQVVREGNTDSVEVECRSSRQTAQATVPSGRLGIRFGPLQQGREHQLKLTLPDGALPITQVRVDELGPLGRRALQ